MIYLDYNATTPLCDPAREAMMPFLGDDFGNPSSIHVAGRQTRAAIDDARDRIAAVLSAKPHEIVFTGGGTESNNLAVLGLAQSRAARGRHVISCKTEHHAVLNAVEYLQKLGGFEVSWIGVSPTGLLDVDELADAIRQDTVLVSIMHANNETGVIQPLAEISQLCRARGVLLHSDMVQSFGKIPILRRETPGQYTPSCAGPLHGRVRIPPSSVRDDVSSLVDCASFAAHKFYGPKGAGFVYLRSDIPIEPINFGGAQENHRRPGTENTAAIAGMTAAVEFVMRERELEQERERKLRDKLWHEISTRVESVVLNGDVDERLGNTLNLSVPELDSETMLMALDVEGVCASSGSACMVGSVVASHVLLAMGLPLEIARSAIRLSLGRHTTEQEISRAADLLSQIVCRTNAKRSAKAEHITV